MLRGTGVNDTEYNICCFLNFYGDASQDMIAKSYAFDKSTVAKALLSLEKRGLITRKTDPANRRRNIISITDKGREQIKDAVGIYDDWVKSISSSLSDAEQIEFERLTGKLLEKAKELKGETKQ
jgi:DNA-binding MarR family transcriptional regulator